MPSLPRPDLPAGHARDLNEALHDLHHRAGWPSLRALARAAGCSHTTVSHVFSSPRIPGWGVLELVVEAMEGDVGEMHRLWLAASTPDESEETDSATPLTRIAGRRHELDAVRRHLTAGRGLLLVVGEGGIGKTTLVRAAAEHARVRLLVGRSLRLSSDIPFLPVASLLQEVRAVDGGAWFRQALDDSATYVPDSLSRLLPELDGQEQPPGPDNAWSRQRLLSAIWCVLHGLAGAHDVAVLIEDVHWADRATLDVLEHLASRDPGIPLVTTTRGYDDPEVPASHREWSTRLARAGAATVVELAPLTFDDTVRQVELLGGPADPDEVRRIFRRSRGQPLFTEQLVSYGAARGLPSALSHLLDQRLAGASPDEWQVLLTLALAGRALTSDQLTAVVATTSDDLVPRLRHLVRQRLVTTTGVSSVEVGHPLLGEAILQRVLPGEAARVHRQLATVLGATDTPPAEVAAHWEHAGDRDQELVWRVRAARLADVQFASASAARHWRRAIDLWPAGTTAVGDPPTTLVSAHFAAMDALADSAQVDAAAELAQRAMALEPEMTKRESGLLYRRCADYVAESDNESALLLLDKAVELLVGTTDPVDLLAAVRLRAGILGELGRFGESLSAAREAAAISQRVHDPDLRRTAHMSVAWHEAIMGDRAAARVHAREAAAIPSWQENPMADIRLSVCHTDILLMSGAPVRDVEAAGRPGLEAAGQWAVDNVQASALRANVAEALRRAGRIREAGEAVDAWTDDGVPLHRWPLGLERAMLDVIRGRAADGEAGFDRLAQMEPPSVLSRADMAQYTALGQLWLGRPQHALDSLLYVLDTMAGSEVTAPMGPLLVLTARAAADLADQVDGTEVQRRDLLGTVLECRRRTAQDPVAATASRVLAAGWEAEVSRLRRTGDVRPWLDSAAAWERRERPHDAGYARWRAAEAVLSSGRSADALLRRAAHDAREHMPLMRAIRAAMARAPTR